MARTQRERDAEKRADKLADIAEQVADGRLTVRKMTADEREKYQRKSPVRAPRTPRGRPS